MRKYDTAVIGGGLAGLAGAAALAAAGRRVVVLEQYSVLGGSTHVFRRKGRWEWQVGVHHLPDCGPNGDIPTVLRGLGLGEHITFEPMDRTGYERYVFPDLVFDAPADWDEFTHRLTALFPRERRALERFLKVVREVGSALDRVPAADVAAIAGRLGHHARLATLSTTEVMDLHGLSDRLRVLLSLSPGGSMNCPPDRLPFAGFATFWNVFISGGSWFPHGGGQVFSANLARVVEQFGGEVVTGAFAEEILVENGRATGVRLRGGATYAADSVVCTADIKKTYASLIPAAAREPEHARRVANYRMATPFFNAFLGAEVDLPALYPNRDHFSMPTWASFADIEELLRYRDGENAEAWIDRVRPVLPAYVHCSNLKDPTNTRYAPAGSSSLEVMFPVRLDYRLWDTAPADRRDHEYSRNPTYRFVKEALTDVMIERATDVLPELEGAITHREAATPMTQERYTQSSEGSSYGIEWNTRQSGFLRPDARTHVDGLFLAGASCRSGPSTEGVLLSGVAAAGAVLGRDLLSEFRAGRPLVPAGSVPAVPVDWDPLAAAKPRRPRPERRAPDLSEVDTSA
ncbi:phytoene desaturase family protein [Umezawaea endophytica]|uniref:NAD(P)/FAD-dependent oxidoreductase n=1 Tax=Umezawaea endophytica TaxID=1654476 RepID=A0A9X2VL74_9PSEU|nr:NAD(P)/FAD-dependent oxidoreductase [Umezawaea endophytica]MCS7478713.1 NAD(P)/FAD-dependent oxidoreductase [Umezawaea endophytica]